MGFHEFIKSEEQDIDLFNAAPSGQKVKFKDAYRAMLKQAEKIVTPLRRR